MICYITSCSKFKLFIKVLHKDGDYKFLSGYCRDCNVTDYNNFGDCEIKTLERYELTRQGLFFLSGETEI